MVRAFLVGDPVLVGIPEGASVEHDDPPARSRETLREDRSSGAAADDQQIDLVLVAEAPHPLPAGDAAPVGVEQERGVVLGREDGALEGVIEVLHSTPRRSTSSTGSTSKASGPSHDSLMPTPSRA